MIDRRFGQRPIRLFRFQLQGAIWRFAQANRDIETPDGTLWHAARIERDDPQQTSERAKDKLKIRLAYLRDPDANPIDVPDTQLLGDLWHPYVPSDKVKVICLDWNYGDTAAPRMVWSGYVSQPAFTDVELELTCLPMSAIGEAKNQGPKSQRACWKPVYSTGLLGCNLDPSLFERAGTIHAIDGLKITVNAFAFGSFSLLQGEFRFNRTVVAHNGAIEIVERRTISRIDGAEATLLYGAAGLEIGQAVVGLPGCEGTWDACAARRDDPEEYFGGLPYKPVKSPYDGESMSWG